LLSGLELNRQLGAHSKIVLLGTAPIGNRLPGLLPKIEDQFWSQRDPLMLQMLSEFW